MQTELLEKLAKLELLLHRQRIRDWAELGPMTDTLRGQGKILTVLKTEDGVSTKDLSQRLGVKVSSLNEQLAKMEKNIYVTREPPEDDKRVMLVKLTEKGKAAQEQSSSLTNVFSCLSQEEQIAFGDYLDRIIAALESI